MIDVHDDRPRGPDYIYIGSEVKRRRKERRWSQEKLGELTGLSQKQVSKIEISGTDSLWKIMSIADVFEITVDELVSDVSSRKRKKED